MPSDRSVRIAIVSDTHGFLDPRVADEITRCDYAVHAGDIGGATVLEAMRPRRGNIFAARGNNDTPQKWPADEAETLDALPAEANLELPGGLLIVVHGHAVGALRARHDRLRKAHTGARAVVCGHSHHLVVDQSQTPWILNPGAAGKARTYGGPCCLLLSATTEDWSVQIRRFKPFRAANKT